MPRASATNTSDDGQKDKDGTSQTQGAAIAQDQGGDSVIVTTLRGLPAACATLSIVATMLFWFSSVCARAGAWLWAV